MEIARNVQKLRHTAQLVCGNLAGEDLRASRRKHCHCRAERFRFAEALSSDTVPVYGGYALQHAIFRWLGCDFTECHMKNLIEQGFSSTEREIAHDVDEKLVHIVVVSVTLFFDLRTIMSHILLARSCSLFLHSAFMWAVLWHQKHILWSLFFAFLDDSVFPSLPLPLPLPSLPLHLAFGFAPSCMCTGWLSTYCCVRVISRISCRICVQLVILTLFRIKYVLHLWHRHAYLDDWLSQS